VPAHWGQALTQATFREEIYDSTGARNEVRLSLCPRGIEIHPVLRDALSALLPQFELEDLNCLPEVDALRP